jgi:hypothetical protein
MAGMEWTNGSTLATAVLAATALTAALSAATPPASFFPHPESSRERAQPPAVARLRSREGEIMARKARSG